MDSSRLLIQAASGLERLMVGTKPGAIKDSNVAQISAFVYYQANVIAKLTTNTQFQNKFRKTIFDQINKDFPDYIDALARSKPKSLHHVYEWNKTGNEEFRLFKLKQISQQGLSFKLDYELLLSKSAVPNAKSKKKFIFAKKASVMEAGMPIRISPRSAERLVFEFGGTTVFMPKGASVVIKSPGGRASTNQFKLAYSRFFSGQLVNESIKRSGFQNIFNAGIGRALKVPTEIRKVQYTFSPGRIRSEADMALASSFGGSL